MSSEALAAQAQALLDAAAAGLALATTGRPVPTHRFRSHGLPNLELCCDNGVLAVWLERIEHRETDPPDLGCQVENYLHWVIGVYRCWPTGGTAPPSDLTYDAAAADLLEDAWAIATEFYDRLRTGSLLTSCGCETVTLGDLTPHDAEPDAGCAGWEFRLEIDASCLTDTGS